MNRAYSLITIKSVDEEHRIIEGIASTPTTDRMGDIVEPKGAVFKVPLPLLWQHRSVEPIGQVVAAKVTDKGIEIRARIAKDLLPRIDEAWALIKSGLVRGLSIGFNPLETADIDGTWGKRFLKWEWLELSAVTVAANQDASIQTIKSIDARQRRAALGHDAGTSRDDSTPSRAREQRPEGTSTMKSLNELRTRRDEVAGRMKELWEACERDRSKLEAEEAKEFDSLKKELGELDGSIEDEAAVERAVKGAVPVVPSAITSQRSGSSARQGRQEDRPKLDPAQKGVAFAQVAKVKWLAKKHNVDPRNIADQMGSRIDPRVAPFLKAAVAGGSVTGSTWGSQLVGDETGVVADFYEFLRPQTILGKFGTGGIPNMTRVPFRVPLAGVTDGGDGYWVGEGAAKPLTAFAFARTTLEPLKVASLCVVTKELLEDSSPAADALLRDLLAGALRERKDRDFIDPTNAGTASIKPASITNAATPIAASGTGDADDVRTDVRAAMQGFIDANNPPTTGVWIMSASTALALSLMQNALGQSEFAGVSMNGGMFAGLPVITSQYVPGGTAGYYVVLANAADIYYGDTGDITVDTSEHATIEMSDNPDGEVGTNVGMFQTNRVAFRAEQRLDWALRRATAVQVISGANWGEA